MFLRCNRRVKDGKAHEYWNVVENRRLIDGRIVQRQVLYLGAINASQREAWRKTIEVHDEGARRQVALFPAGSIPADVVDALGVRLNELRLERPCLEVVMSSNASYADELTFTVNRAVTLAGCNDSTHTFKKVNDKTLNGELAEGRAVSLTRK